MPRIPAKAQASVEYMTIIALVVTGIVVMAPYVIRGINAHFKAADDQIQDSFIEDIRQSPETDFPLPTCECQDFTPRECGAVGSAENCPGTPTALRPCCTTYQRFWKKPCNPNDCDRGMPMGRTEECRDDAGCCSDWVDTACGTRTGPLATPPQPCPANFALNPATACCKNQMQQTRRCNFGAVTQRQCVPHGSCHFDCTSTVPGSAAECTGDSIDLLSDLVWVLVARSGNCTVYTVNASFTAEGGGRVTIQAWGGGGAGGGRRRTGGNGGTISGRGGGGGGYSEETISLVNDAVYAITVGGAGTRSMTQATTNGDFSRVEEDGTNLFTARGGIGCTGENDIVPDPSNPPFGTMPCGAGGNATGGNVLNVDGQNGAPRSGGNGGDGGDSGGGIPIGAGGAGSPDQSPGDPIRGTDGTAPGGAGGGGSDGTNAPSAASQANLGGNGAPGRVVVCGCSDARKCEAYCPMGVPNLAGTACVLQVGRYNVAGITANGVTNASAPSTTTIGCAPGPWTPPHSVTGAGCNEGNPSGATPDASCVVVLD